MKIIMRWLSQPPVDGPESTVLLRVMAGGVFFWEGLLKFAYANQGVGRFTKLGLPVPDVLAPAIAVLEIGGGLLVLVGYQTRLVALGLAIYVLASAFIGHSQLSDPNQFMHFMKNRAIVSGSLAFVASGAGAYTHWMPEL